MDGSTTLADIDANTADESTMPEDTNPPENASESSVDANAEASQTPASENTAATEIVPDGPQVDPKRIVEAVLMAAESPLTPGKIASIVGSGSGRDAKKHIESLNADYDELSLSFRIEEVAGGFQILTRPEYNTWLTKLLRVRQETKLTPAAMETLAIIAYKQPCTRAEVEAIRGVAAGDMINRLREMNVVKIAGRAEDLGRPLLYGTTRRFLEVFGLPSLEDLPQVEALRPPSAKAPKPDVDETIVEKKSDSSEKRDASTDDAGATEASPALHIVHDEDESESVDARAEESN